MRACDLSFFEPAGCKMLLLEILRRAAHDWVLYRSSTRLLQKQIAEEAYHWLFVEEPGTRAWVDRAMDKKELTSLFGICEVLSLEPEVVRHYVKGLTIKEILSTGRPPTYRRQKERRRKLPAPILLLPEVAPVPTIVVYIPRITHHSTMSADMLVLVALAVETATAVLHHIAS